MDLLYGDCGRDDVDRIAEGLKRYGQVRPVLLDDLGYVAGRGYLVDAASFLGWTHIAARLQVSETATASTPQLTFGDEVERRPERSADDLIAIKAFSVQEALAEDAETINAATRDATMEWVGLPEFVGTGEPFKVVISLDSEEDRDALFSLLGIETIHKGTRGTLSVWWPERAKEDLASLRFIDDLADAA